MEPYQPTFIRCAFGGHCLVNCPHRGWNTCTVNAMVKKQPKKIHYWKREKEESYEDLRNM